MSPVIRFGASDTPAKVASFLRQFNALLASGVDLIHNVESFYAAVQRLNQTLGTSAQVASPETVAVQPQVAWFRWAWDGYAWRLVRWDGRTWVWA